ncbi:MAG: EFR1 family ferrodoxin [Bacteroidales bacterium]|nr:EFR1 family ferrodoxin [Bacteroidales bacterium]
MILWFSGCGNSRYVAEELARLTDDRLAFIDPNDKSPRIELSPDEALGFVCPVYAWAVPRLVDDFVRRMTLTGRPSYCYLACTCGDNVGRTPERFSKTLSKQGLTLNAAFGFVMPETYINLRGFNLDSPENEQRKIAAVKERLPRVAEQIMQRKETVDVVRGTAPWITSYLINPLFYGLLITDRKFHVNDDCIHCGICEKSCPLGNIAIKEGLPVWQGNCTNCMSCYHHCPKNAIHFGKATLGKGQYFFRTHD